MTRGIAALIVIAAVLFMASPAFPRAVPGETRVSGVRFEYPGELPESLPGLVSMEPGDSYSPRRIREAIRLIYLMGLFEDIVVEGEDTPSGVVLTFRLTPKTRIADIDISGNDDVPDGDVLKAVTLEAGGFLDKSRLGVSREAVAKLCRQDGFPDCKVDIQVKPVDSLTADIAVAVDEGPPDIVDAVKFAGSPALTDKEMLDALEFEPGDRLTKKALDQSVEALAALYVENDYVNVEVTEPAVSKDGHKVAVTFDVKSGPRLDVAFEGNDNISSGKLKDVLTFWEDREVSPETVSEDQDRIIRLYRDKGYYHVAVTSQTEEGGTPPMTHVRYIISEGPRAALGKIIFNGNEVLEDGDLEGVMELSGSSVFKDRFITDDAVEKDVERIKALYESKGFLNANVSAEPIDFSQGGKLASLTIDIEEGPRTIVRDILLKGNSGLSAEELLAVVGHEKDVPFSPRQMERDRNAILNLYSQKGYIHATVDIEKEFSGDATGLVVILDIKEGFPVYIGNIILKGNREARDIVVLRELLFKKGDVYDYEKILRSQQKVYKLGFMSQVRIQPVNPDKAEAVKDMLVSVVERDAGSIEFGVGYGEFDLYRGSAEVSYRNLWGYGHRVSLRGEISTRETKSVLSYTWPWFGGLALDFRSSLVYLDAEKPNYKIKDQISSAGFDKSWNDNVTGSIIYQYEKIKLDAPDGAVLAPEDRNKSNLASISPSVVFDYRNNPFNATSGSINGLVVKWASSYIGSTVDFMKITGQSSWYFPAYGDIVFGFSVRGGMEGFFKEKLEVPISERFFLGGASTLRGYEFESVAPRGFDGTPAGGDTMLLMNAEMRFPLFYGFGLVGFLDAGNVWLLNKNVSFVPSGQQGATGLRYGTGVGLRYDTPVGPLRLDYGFKLDRRPGESSGVLHFTLGQAF